jgi:hypothetical protein
MTILRANVLLERVRRDLARLETRLDKAHGLGDDESSMGTSSSHRDNLQWENKRDGLRACEDWLIQYINWMNSGCTGPRPGPLGRSLGAYLNN